MTEFNLNELPIAIWGIIATLLGIAIGNLVSIFNSYVSYRSSIKSLSTGPFQELFKKRIETLTELVAVWANIQVNYQQYLYKLTKDNLEQEEIEFYLDQLNEFSENFRSVEIKLRSFFSNEIDAFLNILIFMLNDFQNFALNKIQEHNKISEEDVKSHISSTKDMFNTLIDFVKKECGVSYINKEIESALNKTRFSWIKKVYRKIKLLFFDKSQFTKHREYVKEREKEIEDFRTKRAKGETKI